ncbi:uncharacterized protein DUF1761 [Mucilaginibacter yixingensis]|uniref:Uncharacterized protein DUF1761 n=1 Tax=Mucilaginibacter yixingensis TaxID=1295612 RepID=A0A2T5JA39_9SPHI|nr:DUF1761 domain-containing protein [Mucilaginibacter yixingensis]PTQ96918.1 uncharacterized protein DUF1761 [Mucilaginibacter yixingensis]
MDPKLINWAAVATAALSAFLIGGIWYSSALFGDAWLTDSKLTESDIQNGNKGKIFGFTAVFSLLMSFNLSLFIAMTHADIGRGSAIGFHAGIWTFCAIAIHSLFELKGWRYIFINGGYSLLTLTLMGTILGWWH